ncbi:hypothetical protein BGZ99_009719 [Dissophora globulifera]|uniref:Uncharacterized protein n=1 Tax=Dissophora globulifera TaxID=979702 RepID=A0A9P6R8N2_9FUNG|nr:hypothetical protein BGZ99_009719 [Dissophora globulifera]
MAGELLRKERGVDIFTSHSVADVIQKLQVNETQWVVAGVRLETPETDSTSNSGINDEMKEMVNVVAKYLKQTDKAYEAASPQADSSQDGRAGQESMTTGSVTVNEDKSSKRSAPLMESALLMHSDWEVNLPTEDEIDMDEVGGNLKRTLFKIALLNLQQVQESFSKEGFDKFKTYHSRMHYRQQNLSSN